MIKRLSISILVLLFALSSWGNNPIMVWVEFTDKENSHYSLSRPYEFLSQRAIERRQKQNIPLDFYDLPVSPYYLQTLAADTSIVVYYSSKWFNGAMLNVRYAEALQRLDNYEFISYWEDVKPQPPLPEDKKPEEINGSQAFDGYSFDPAMFYEEFPYSILHTFNNYPDYGEAENQVKLVNGQALHARGYWGRNKVIAVLDAGYRSVDTLGGFNFLWEQNRILGYRDFVDPGGNVFNSHPHGTYVLSVMGGHLPGKYSGAALGASYWLLRTEDASSEFRIEEYNWLAGAEFADSVGADIINSSLGYTRFDDPAQNYEYSDLDGQTTVIARAANKAFSKGILVVSSAGNYGAQSWRYIGSPADAHGALAVGGTNSEGQRVNFSSVGPSADGRVKPEVMAQGQGVSVLNLVGSTANANGTSFSAPLVAGMAACLWQKFPRATNEQVQNAIIRSADRYMMPDSLYGYGIPDFGKAVEILRGPYESTLPVAMILNNPLVPDSAIRFFAEGNETISIDFINSSGQKIWTLNNLEVLSGYNEVRPFRDIGVLASGIYIVRINFKNRSEFIKAIKL
ncbi:MAG: S8 family serine peptidase [Bacteroidales bacterium]|nr:S8 family serine peptidase [Bacteroidales bacterium]